MKRNMLLLVLLVACQCSIAQWVGNAETGGIPVCNAATTEESKLVISDGSNGMFVVFKSQNGNIPSASANLYAQHINSSGQVQWGNAGAPKPVSVVANEKNVERMLPDGSGGVYILWSVYRADQDSSDFYLQRLNNTGNAAWAVNGIKVNQTNSRERFWAELVSDGSSGVIVVWNESVYDTTTALTTYGQAFAQKYNSAGVKQWAASGVQICTAAGIRAAGAAVPDGSGGVVISFTDTRNANQLPDDDFDNLDVYAQRLNSSGVLQWTVNGAAVNTQPFNQQNSFAAFQASTAVGDGAGGMILMMEDYTGDNYGNGNVYAQKINGSGARQWAAAGVPICLADSVEYIAKVLPDGAGGVVVFWNDDREGGFFTSAYYAQRISTTGVTAWTSNGVQLFEGFGFFGSFGFDVTADGAGNYVFVWSDYNDGALRAQKINGNAAFQWVAGGVDVCTNPDASPYLGQIVQSNAGQTIVSWIDSRNNATSDDIYAAKLTTAGALVNGGVVSTSFITAANGNWNVAATWVGGVVPTTTSDCSVRHNVTVTVSASCKSLQVQQPNGRLTVNTGVNLTVLQ